MIQAPMNRLTLIPAMTSIPTFRGWTIQQVLMNIGKVPNQLEFLCNARFPPLYFSSGQHFESQPDHAFLVHEIIFHLFGTAN